MIATSFVLLFLFSRASAQRGSVEVVKDQDAECLNKHNEFRNLHQSTLNLELDPTITASAQKHAEYLASTGSFDHSKNRLYGENLYSSSGLPIVGACVKASTSWYNEISKYNFNRPGFSSNTGHFTQVVWKDSKKVGFGIAKNKNRVVIVAQYSPPGNNLRTFALNVLPLKK